jgi:hypothetical protein
MNRTGGSDEKKKLQGGIPKPENSLILPYKKKGFV